MQCYHSMKQSIMFSLGAHSNNHTNFLIMSKIKAFLNENKMGKLIARLLGKQELAINDDGKPVLSQEEKSKITALYGENFLQKFESISFNSEADDTHELFDAAVSHKVAEVAANKDAIIAQLRSDLEILASAPESDPAKSQASAAKNVTSILNMAAKHNALVHAAFNEGRIVTAADNPTLDVSDLNQEFTVAMPPRARIELVNKEIYLGFPDAQHFTRIQSNTDYVASDALVDSVVQEFTPVWTPKGSAKFTPIRIPYRRHKINVSIKPAEIIPSWLLYMYEQNKTMAEMPITKYIIYQHILPRVQDDLTRKMVGKGKYEKAPAGVAAGSAGRDASQAMDGLETQLVKALADGKTKMNFFANAQNLLNLEGQTFLTAFHNYVDAISKYFVGDLPIHCSEAMVTHYNRQDFAVNGKYTGENVGTAVRFTNFTLVPLKSMYNSPILFATPKANLVELVDINSAQNLIQKIEENHYDVDILGEFSLSVGFKIEEAVFAYVPAGYDPASAVISDSSDITATGSVWTHGGANPTNETEGA